MDELRAVVMRYPWRPVLLATLGVVLMLILGTTLIDLSFRWQLDQEYDDDRYHALKGTCYWAGDARNYMYIALDGYTSYDRALLTPHLTQLDERSWWPLFPVLAGQVISWGGGSCSSRTVNGVAYVLLVPIFQALTKERRWWRLLLLGMLPFGAWMYVGEADTFFLALSGLLVLAVRGAPDAPRRAGVLSFVAGVVLGLAKPNALALIPALGIWGLTWIAAHLRAMPPPEKRRAWIGRILSDANPGWAPLLAALGIVLSTMWWIYQTSGYYPYYVLMVQRSLWWHEFKAWDPVSFSQNFHLAIEYARTGRINMSELQRLVELSAVLFGLALCVSCLPPCWPGGERSLIPLHWRVGVLSIFVLMFASGQSHAFERYTVSNVFVMLAYYRRVFGTPEHPPDWRIWTLPGLLRWLWLLCAPVMWVLTYLLLGWNPLNYWL